MSPGPRRNLPSRRGQSAIEWILIIALIVVILMLGVFLMRRQLMSAAVRIGEAVGLWSKEEEEAPPAPGATPGAKGATSGSGAKSGSGTGTGGAKGATGPAVGGKTALEMQKAGGAESGTKGKKKTEAEIEFERRQRESGPAGQPGGGRGRGGGDGGGLFGLSLGKQIFVLGAGLGVLVGAGIFVRMLRRR